MQKDYVVQHPNKTAICHVDYELGGTTKIHVIPIKVSRADENTEKRVTVVSKRLRRKAISEYLSKHGLEDSVAFQLSAKNTATLRNESDNDSYPTDHLIFFESDKKAFLRVKTKKKTNYQLSETVATIRSGSGQTVCFPVYCSLDHDQKQVLNGKDFESSEYWKKISFLVRKGIQMTVAKRGITLASTTKTGAILQEATKKTGSKTAHTRMMDNRITVRGAQKLNILFRTTPKLDPAQRKLRIEIDLVAGVRGDTNVAGLALSILGRVVLDPGNDHYLAQLRTTLIGLQVVRIYSRKSDTTTAEKGLTNRNSISVPQLCPLSPLTDAQANSRALVGSSSWEITVDISGSFEESTIIDIKPTGEIPHFWKEGVEYSVTKYLKTKYGEVAESRFPNMPLANIGGETWVPLELLKTVGSSTELQGIPSIGDIKASLQEKRSQYNLEDNKENLRKFSDNLINGLQNFHPDMARILPKSQGALTAVDCFPQITTSSKNDPAKASANGSGIRCGIIHIQSNRTRYPTSGDIANAILELFKDHGHLDEKDRIVNIDTSFTSPVACFYNAKALLLLDEGHPMINPFHENKPNTIVAIIDESGRDEKEIRHIRGEVQRFGNTKIGATVLCITRKELEAETEKSAGLQIHLPVGMLQQMNVMHGQPNFAVKKLLDLPARKLMIVGAHISHPGSKSARSCVSVASLVGSTDTALVHYPGSAGLQPTLKSARRGKHEVNSHIEQLESMMVERIQAWISEQGVTEAPHIVFYRHSIPDFDLGTIDADILAIQKACDWFSWDNGKATFGYVLVTKNTHSISPYGDISINSLAADTYTFRMCEDATKGVGYKYQYYVQHIPNDALSGEQYKMLTRHINSNYQLSKSAKVAIALPVHYAQKLARRVYDYFRFAGTNPHDGLSSVQPPLQRANGNDSKSEEEIVSRMNGCVIGDEAVQALTLPGQLRNPWMKEINGKIFYL